MKFGMAFKDGVTDVRASRAPASRCAGRGLATAFDDVTGQTPPPAGQSSVAQPNSCISAQCHHAVRSAGDDDLRPSSSARLTGSAPR